MGAEAVSRPVAALTGPELNCGLGDGGILLKKTAVVISVLAALLLASGAIAAKKYLITSSAQIKPGAISLASLSRAAKAGLAGHPGANGQAGPAGPQGPKGDTGATGPAGPAGPKGSDGKDGKSAPAPEYGVADVLVSRGGHPATTWARYSTTLGSPVGDTTSGTFRFTCSTANAPCTVSVAAAVLSANSESVGVYPRVLIMRQDYNAGGPEVYCEYGDGSTGAAPVSVASQSPSSTPTMTPMQINIGGTADCNGPVSTAGDVSVITVPDGYYDVSSTFVFKK